MAQKTTSQLSFWAVAMTLVAVAAAYLRSRVGIGYHLGDLTAVALMVSGTCIILVSQRQAAAGDAPAA
ncbi:hypothetical protein [Roseicella aquatilis]|uniref:Uncharacterized protein n=1 Tax=Roseicella aquatilis TaxID=2527868 RepID=A0A4R4D6U4_9PROT|nr:hypothetical protein [Roseicella aquatilis]TCZ55944.1 hypothetical protein EXY23_20310 [Roseicella aquatilis]